MRSARVLQTMTFLFLLGGGVTGLGEGIKIGNQVEPKDLDPQIVSGIQEEHLFNQLFEGLYMKDPNTLKSVPGVAESYSLSNDAKVYIFRLRENARWSDNTPVTAKIVCKSL